jgi:dTMP kinase
VHGDCNPDVTLLFDVPPDVSRERLMKVEREGRTLDKFEREEQGFFERVRAVYAARAAAEPGRFRVIDATRSLDEVRAELGRIVAAL